jgi:alpha-amylase
MKIVQRTARFALIVVFLLIGVSAPPPQAYAQAGFEDDRVMIQGFYWESSRHGFQQKFPQFGSEHWYAIIAREAPKIRAARFDLIWLPPPSFAGGFSAGYDPREYFALDNSYGTFMEQRDALEALLTNGVEPVADIVINHRNGSRGWADFNNPAWGTWSITRDDEAFSNPSSEVFNIPVSQRGAHFRRCSVRGRSSCRLVGSIACSIPTPADTRPLLQGGSASPFPPP